MKSLRTTIQESLLGGNRSTLLFNGSFRPLNKPCMWLLKLLDDNNISAKNWWFQTPAMLSDDITDEYLTPLINFIEKKYKPIEELSTDMNADNNTDKSDIEILLNTVSAQFKKNKVLAIVLPKNKHIAVFDARSNCGVIVSEDWSGPMIFQKVQNVKSGGVDLGLITALARLLLGHDKFVLYGVDKEIFNYLDVIF